MALAWWLVLTAVLPRRAGALESLEPMGRVQLAGDSWLREERSGKDFESDELPPSNAHRQPMPGQRPGSAVTAPSNGYDAKHLNRLWGRFRGAKANPKEKKPKK